MSAPHPYASFLSQVSKPSRYVGGEFGQSLKADADVSGRICLAFPDLYDIGMSHLGFKILYGLINGHSDLAAERAYAPWSDMEEQLRAHNEPLRSLESARPLSDFDVVGFSLQFELNFTNVLLMLDLGGIPLRTSARSENDPLVLAGGPTATHPEALAPFLDAIVIGDGEEKAVSVLRTWTNLKRAGVARAARLRALADLGGVYVPSLYATKTDTASRLDVVVEPEDPTLAFPIQRAMVANLNDYPFPSRVPVASTETTFDRVAVEIARGCTEGCRFCQAGMIYRPVRERDPESVLESISDALATGGYDEASLTCLSTADYSAIHPLVKSVMQRLEKDKVSLSVSSLRAYGLDEDLLDELRKVRANGLTFAPEAGSQRMRDVVNKNITEEQLMTTADRVFSRGWSRMKLYFMVGLPTEEMEDVLGIVETAARARDVGKKYHGRKGPDVTASVSVHVPKPHTPFQWCAMDAPASIDEKQKAMFKRARELSVSLRMNASDSGWIEAVLARGDRKVAEVVATAYENGARFDSWDECLRADVWFSAFAEHNIDTSVYLSTLPVHGRLPWDHIDVGLEDGFLAREYRKSLASRLSPPCGKVAGMFVHHTNLNEAEQDARRLVCYDCGVACDLTEMREERLVFLRKLGAHERTTPAPQAEPMRNSKRRPPAIAQSLESTRIRLEYSKIGVAAYRGHLDLVKVLPRILRRAGLRLFYTQGFHPRPDLVFGPALPLGIVGLREYVDVRIENELEGTLEELTANLNARSEDGLVFRAATRLSKHDLALSKHIQRAEYLIGVPVSTLAECGLANAAESIERIESRRTQPLFAERSIEGIRKRVAVSEYLDAVDTAVDAETLERAGIVGVPFGFRLQIRITGQGTAKALETAACLLGSHDGIAVDSESFAAIAVRTGLFSVDVDGRMESPLVARAVVHAQETLSAGA